ncbi:hypothetical protein FQN60_007683, partial [Etheostoma spectabile]
MRKFLKAEEEEGKPTSWIGFFFEEEKKTFDTSFCALPFLKPSGVQGGLGHDAMGSLDPEADLGNYNQSADYTHYGSSGQVGEARADGRAGRLKQRQRLALGESSLVDVVCCRLP